MTVTVIDLESTGLDPAKDAVVELAAVDVTADGEITHRREHLICPPVSIPASASAIHHLLDEDVAGKPPFREVIELYSGSCAYVSHGADFERGFLAEHLGVSRKTGQPPTWICTYKCALRVWPDAASHSNQSLRYALNLASPFGIDRHTLVPHRALSDAIVTAAIFVELLKHARWSQLAMWSAEPALHTTLTFGKHKGTKYAEAPQDYLDWIINKSDLDEGVKFSARHALQLQSRGS
jgi:exodeoxyribonuclease X